MKTRILITAMMVAIAGVAQASLFSYSWNVGSTIPDANPTGILISQDISNIPVIDVNNNDTIRDVNVLVEISGGFNGDLYGYLVSPNGTRVELFNRPGPGAFGNSGSYFNVLLDDSASTSVDSIAAIGNIGAVNSPASYQANGSLDSFANGVNHVANGTWQLFLADLSGGDTSGLVKWGLQIEVVPEPTTWALVIFGIVVCLQQAGSWFVARRKTKNAVAFDV